MANQRIYFPGLDAIRAYAAVSVLIVHAEQLQILLGFKPVSGLFGVLKRLIPTGADSVTLFFVLSGFLITFLLLTEQRQTGGIDVGKFYLRRILRIWPLYYLLMAIGFIGLPAVLGYQHYPYIQPDAQWSSKVLLFAAMMANVALSFLPAAIPVAHLWSIGVEEQFYLIWPNLMKWFGRRVPQVAVAVITTKVVLLLALAKFQAVHPPGWNWWLDGMVIWLRLTRLESMAVGALAAWLVFRHREVVSRIAHRRASGAIVLTLMGIHVAFFGSVGIGSELALAGLYAALIVTLGCNPRPIVRLDRPIYRFVGRISYGVYMYHVPVMFLALQWLKRLNAAGDVHLLQNMALLALLAGLSVAVATGSYYLFELPFLNAKRRFAVVPSGPTDQPPLDVRKFQPAPEYRRAA